MNFIWIIHFILLFFILFGWSILPNWSLKYQMLVVPIIFLDWNDYDGACILTKLEHYFKTGEWKQKSALESGPEFFRPLLEYILNRDIDRITAERINYTLFIISWLITYYKFCKFHKIKFKFL